MTVPRHEGSSMRCHETRDPGKQSVTQDTDHPAWILDSRGQLVLRIVMVDGDCLLQTRMNGGPISTRTLGPAARLTLIEQLQR